MDNITEIINSITGAIGAVPDILHGNELTLAVVIFIIALMLYGHWRGFFRMCTSVLSIVISLAAVRLAAPQAEHYLRDSGLVQNIAGQLAEKLLDYTEESVGDSLIIRLLGLDTLAENAASQLSALIIKVICFLLIFILVKIIVRVIINVLDMFAAVPIISGLNQIAGAVVGFAEGVVYVWIFMMVMMIFSYTSFGSYVMARIHSDPLLGFIYENNLILRFLAGIVSAL